MLSRLRIPEISTNVRSVIANMSSFIYNQHYQFSTNTTSNIIYGFESQQGLRDNMEDHIIHNNNFSMNNSLITSGSLFAVFDGHYGMKCSEFLKNNMEEYLSSNIHKYSNFEQIFENTIKQIDTKILESKNEDYELYASGSTSCISIIDHNRNKIFISHVGDSRCLLIDKNNSITQLTVDHHPNYHDGEWKRLSKIGQFGMSAPRELITWYENGDCGVAMTRCIGDGPIREDKHNDSIFLSTPEFIEYEYDENDKYLILCSDGLYHDVEEFKVMFDKVITTDSTTTDILAKQLTAMAIPITGDNVSVIIVQLSS